MNIISASRRTDIPAFYSDWLISQIKQGYCNVANPFNPKQIRQVSLTPQDILCLAFWSKNPEPLEQYWNYLDELKIKYYLHFTITGYGSPLEGDVISLKQAIETAKRWAEQIGPEFVLWRYDPIIITEPIPWDAHLVRFDRIAHRLKGFTTRCYISFVQLYQKTLRAMENLSMKTGNWRFWYSEQDVNKTKTATKTKLGTALSTNNMREMASELAASAESYGISLYSCCNKSLCSPNVKQAHCIDPELIWKLLVSTDNESRMHAVNQLKIKPTRKDCGCYTSMDIGKYNSCLHGCEYCYAVGSKQKAYQEFLRINQENEFK